MPLPSRQPDERRLAVTVRGVIQGVGFRPFVYNTARAEGLAGCVRNEADRVRIDVQGPPTAIERFLDRLRHRAPPAARIDSLEIEEFALDDVLPPGEFHIVASGGAAPPGVAIPADLATCAECLAEIRAPGERRHDYPFTNCTNCGPRWSIIRGVPYDRPRTSMAGFAMCADCRREYDDPTDRRFHAQPIACPACGPRLQLLDVGGNRLARDDDALYHAIETVLNGRIVAMKGLGGFQFLCDATDQQAVERLRERKRRPDRPFAVMIGSIDVVRAYCRVSEAEAAVLGSPEAPIVLLHRLGATVGSSSGIGVPSPPAPLPPAGEAGTERRASPADQWPTLNHPSPVDRDQTPVADAVAPGNPYLGVMLPYTPLHHLLIGAIGRPIVCTSGNLADEPMAIDTVEAVERLGPIADVILTHDRPIVRPVDDSVVRVDSEGVQVLRRARGYAPRAVPIFPQSDDTDGTPLAPSVLPSAADERAAGDEGTPTRLGTPPATPGRNADEMSAAVGRPGILAVGGHLKSAVGVALPGEHPVAVIGAHIGDLDSVPATDVHRRAIDDLLDFFAITPAAIACDLHPDYASTREAERRATLPNQPTEASSRLLRVQHHHAHVAAAMAEHGLNGPVVGLAWDGTGYGTDGTVWGGEVLRCERDRFERVGHLRTFTLPGGEKATREPRRSALGVLWDRFGGDVDQITPIVRAWFEPGELDLLLGALRRGVNCPRTSSMGRLFDAVAALVGLPPVISFEGQAAMALEFAVPGRPMPSAAPGRRPGPLPEKAGTDADATAGLSGNADGPSASTRFPPAGDGAERPASPAVEWPTLSHASPAVFDWRPLIDAVLGDLAAGVGVGRIAARFHHTLADLAVTAANRTDLPDVVLTGGCFQNAVLTDLVRRRLIEAGHRVYTAREFPPGDGGVALGQLFVALHRLQSAPTRAV